jgi:hypothetical protein
MSGRKAHNKSLQWFTNKMDETQNYLVEETQDKAETTENQEETASVSDDKFKELDAQKKHWREKAEKFSSEKKLLEDELNKLKSQQQSEPKLYATRDELVDIKLGNMGLDAETASFVKTYAKGAGKEPIEVLEDPAVKAFLDKKKQDKELANATPSPSSRTISFQGKTLNEMNATEKLQVLKELGSESAKSISRR